MKRRLKTNGLLIIFAVMLIICLPGIFLRKPNGMLPDTFAKVFGFTFVLLGQLFRACGRGYKSEHSQSGHSLIQGGPYAFVRNPMYLGILLIGLGVVLVLFQWWVAVVFLCIFIWRYILLMLQEEKKLLAMFPGEYKSYQKNVPRLIPAVSVIFTRDIIEYLPLKLSWLKKEIGSMLAVASVTLLFAAWQDLRSRNIRICLQDTVGLLTVIIIVTFSVIYLIKRTKKQRKYAPSKR
jgi:protein-S-isoprenylcysteine O-methyltransferase Ste14